jgi:hypothetical protein
MKRTVLILLLITCLANVNYSQNFNWANQAGAAQNDTGIAIGVDIPGNSYVTGSFQNTINFPSASFTSLGGTQDIFVAKYDRNGLFLWARAASGPSSEEGDGISVDAQGNAYVTGTFIGTVQFATSQSITSSGNSDIFIAKYDTNGVFLWAVHCGGTGQDGGNGIAVTPAGDVYVTGSFVNTATFNSTSGPSTPIGSGGSGDIFVARYNSNGVLQWVKKAGGTNLDVGTAISVDSQNNSYVTGHFASQMNWSGTVVTPAGIDAFVAKFDPLGNIVWSRTMKGPGLGAGGGISVDSSGSPYVAGLYTDSVVFSGSSTSFNTPGNGADIFIARYATNGQFLWARRAGGPGADRASGIGVRGTGEPYITGFFSGTATFGNQQVTSLGVGGDIFVARYNQTGTLLWVKQAGGTQSEQGRGIGVDDAQRAYVTGGYQSNPASFASTINLTNTNTGTANFFVARIK